MANRTYQFNKRAEVTHKMVKNPEGGIVFEENPDLALFLNMSAFKLRNSFYWNAGDTLVVLEDLLDSNTDVVLKLAISKFLSEMLGVRLAPVIAVTREAIRSKEASTYDDCIKELVSETASHVMDRPDKIANSLAYGQYMLGTFKRLPPYYKRALRDAFQRFDAYTLRKFKLKRRMVKASDMIKALHPKPRNDKMSELYKAIIENRPEAAIEKGTVITEVLSDSTKSKKEKKEWMNKNVDNIPFNALIRNLNSIPVNVDTVRALDNRLSKALRVENGLPVVKVANPFDVLTAGIHSQSLEFTEVVDKHLSRFAEQINLGLEGVKVSILVDISGSMGPGWFNTRSGEYGTDIVADYLALLMPALCLSYVNLYAFNTRLHDRTNLVPLFLRNVDSPITLRHLIKDKFLPKGGTSLADAVRKVVAKDSPELLMVFSDEISWADKGKSRLFDVGCSVIAVNPYPQSVSTVFNPHKPVVKLSAIDAKIFYYIPILSNFGKFKKWIKDWAFGRKYNYIIRRL